MPQVSAILLCYNCPDLVAAAVRSLLAQHYDGPVDWQVKTFRRAADSGSKSAHPHLRGRSGHFPQRVDYDLHCSRLEPADPMDSHELPTRAGKIIKCDVVNME